LNDQAIAARLLEVMSEIHPETLHPVPKGNGRKEV
jgi:hypothetical protein